MLTPHVIFVTTSFLSYLIIRKLWVGDKIVPSWKANEVLIILLYLCAVDSVHSDMLVMVLTPGYSCIVEI